MVDAGEVLVKTCYFLEGDGYVVLKAYDRMKAVELGMNAPTFPNVIALASQKYADPVVQVEQLEKWVNYAKECILFLDPFKSCYACPLAVTSKKPKSYKTSYKTN